MKSQRNFKSALDEPALEDRFSIKVPFYARIQPAAMNVVNDNYLISALIQL